jgi:hypothetical protein
MSPFCPSPEFDANFVFKDSSAGLEFNANSKDYSGTYGFEDILYLLSTTGTKEP